MARKGRRIRFSLRALLLLLTFCGIFSGWLWPSKIRPAYRRKAAISHFRALNVQLQYGVPARTPGHDFHGFYPDRTPTLDAPLWIQKWIGSEWFESPPRAIWCISATRPIEDDDVRYLAGLPDLEQIELNCHQVKTDPNYAHTGALRESRITDVSLQTLAQLPRLRRIVVSEANLSDRGMTYLAESQSLEALAIAHSDISDAGLLALAKISTLQALNVRGTQVTANGVADFAARRPDVRLFVDAEVKRLLPSEVSSGSINPIIQVDRGPYRDSKEWRVREVRTLIPGVQETFYEKVNAIDANTVVDDSPVPLPSDKSHPSPSWPPENGKTPDFASLQALRDALRSGADPGAFQYSESTGKDDEVESSGPPQDPRAQNSEN